MFDELNLLRESPQLQQLLSHYIEASPEDQEAWQDRLMHLDGVEAQDLARLHGQLIAFNLVEQNTGSTSVLRPGAVPCCYLVTTAGRRALQAARSAKTKDEDEAFTPVNRSQESAPRKKREPRVPKRRETRRSQVEEEKVTSTKDPDLTAEIAGLPAANPAGEESPILCLTGDPA